MKTGLQKNLILEIGAEGGSITLFRIVKEEQTRYIVNTNESDLEDNFYHSEKSFGNLDDAVRYIYLKYPILGLYLVSVNPEYILPIGKIINDNTRFKNTESDPIQAKNDDIKTQKNIQKTSPEKWNELNDKINEIRRLKIKESGSNESNSTEIGKAIFQMHNLVHEANIVNPFAWSDWDEGRWLLMAPGTDFNQLDTVTLCKLVTSIVRNDRFCDGAWESSFFDGSMVKILEALVQRNLP
jgi:hypothetical protein